MQTDTGCLKLTCPGALEWGMGFGVELYISKSRTSKANSLMQYTYTDMHTYISVHRAPPDVAAVFGYLVSISVLVLFPLWLLTNTHTHTHRRQAGTHRHICASTCSRCLCMHTKQLQLQFDAQTKAELSSRYTAALALILFWARKCNFCLRSR